MGLLPGLTGFYTIMRTSTISRSTVGRFNCNVDPKLARVMGWRRRATIHTNIFNHPTNTIDLKTILEAHDIQTNTVLVLEVASIGDSIT